jgi:hypothetical protein
MSRSRTRKHYRAVRESYDDGFFVPEEETRTIVTGIIITFFFTFLLGLLFGHAVTTMRR